MIRRGLIFGALSVLLTTVVATVAAADSPSGPRLAYIHLGVKPGVLEIDTSDPGGGAVERIAGGGKRDLPLPFLDSQLSWAPDGSMVAYAGTATPGHALRPEGRAIFLVPADGGQSSQVPGTAGGLFPVLSPDGEELAYVRLLGGGDSSTTLPNGKVHRIFAHSSIWITSLDDGETRRLTPWGRDIPNVPSSFSPDGSVLGITRSSPQGGSAQAVALRVDGSGSRVIATGAGSPVYSPDGSKIALLRLRRIPYHGHEKRAPKFEETTDLFVVNADGSSGKRLTRTRAIDLSPSWDPSGARLAYVAYSVDGNDDSIFGFGDAIMQVNADGTCTTEVLSAAGDAFLSPVWQPGTGREAGPIAC